jgi:hypothetical protein
LSNSFDENTSIDKHIFNSQIKHIKFLKNLYQKHVLGPLKLVDRNGIFLKITLKSWRQILNEEFTQNVEKNFKGFLDSVWRIFLSETAFFDDFIASNIIKL